MSARAPARMCPHGPPLGIKEKAARAFTRAASCFRFVSYCQVGVSVYLSVEDATHVADDDLVITLSYKGEYRAYPSKILDHHEIVNDTVGGDPLAITWCPLCGSAVGIRRIVAGKTT